MSTEATDFIKDRYGKIALSLRQSNEDGCCSSATRCCGTGINDTTRNYADIDLTGLPREAIEASLGCANPLVFAQIQEGETILDLGSGAGIDVLISSGLVGDSGLVYGLDMTDEMITLAEENKKRMGVSNVEFIKGYIEEIPLGDNQVDVVISNCVINLAADKAKALEEAFRIIKPGGRLRIADIVTLKDVDPSLSQQMGMWSSCLAGALTIEEYKSVLLACGFVNPQIEVVNVYSHDILSNEFLPQMDLTPDIQESLEGAFAGALISADKAYSN